MSKHARPRGLPVDGVERPTADGWTFPVRDPATAEPLWDVPDAGVADVRLEVSGAPGCLAQVIGPVGPLAAAFTDGSGRATVSVQTPAAGTPFVRAEVRRLDAEPVLNPLEGVPGLPMVAMTNPVFLR